MARLPDGVPNESLEQGYQIRHYLHAHPELSGHEHATAHYLQQHLEAWGWQVVAPVAGSPSRLASLPGCSGPTLALRAELDALPIDEPANAPYCSAHPGAMHACGHDIHMAIAMTMAHALSHAPQRPSYNPLLIFESSEEVLPGGAQAILASNAFRQAAPQHIFALHCEPTLEVGAIGLRPGQYMASGDEVYITIEGHGGHAALPHTLTDPLLTAAHTLIALQTIAARLTPPGTSCVLSFGHIANAGAMNLIPDTARLEGTLRTHCPAWRQEAKRHIARLATQTAAAFGAKALVDIRAGYPPLRNDEALTQRAETILQNLPAITRIEHLDLRMTTDDFAYFAEAIPSLYLRLGVGPTGNLHSATFSPNEAALRVATATVLALFDGLAQ